MLMDFRMTLLIQLLIVGTSELEDDSLLYSTHANSKTNFDCFYAHLINNLDRIDGTFLRTNYLTPFCRRPSGNEMRNENFIVTGINVKNQVKFADLRSQRVTSEDLLEWSIAIDIIEQYAIYLIKNKTEFAESIFYNCTSPWFGSHCQYTFGSNSLSESFGDFVDSSFNNRKNYQDQLTINTCYPSLSGCSRGPDPMCLDWREICNGVIDCIGENFGIDEHYCDQLEMNECQDDEYRCHNGAQCIPSEFFRDGWTSKDCLDGTDEEEQFRNSPAYNDYHQLDCINMWTFPCEERSCRNTQVFPCGDGNCLGTGLIGNHFKGTSCHSTRRDISYLRAVYETLDHLPRECQKLIRHKFGLYSPSINDTYDEDSDALENESSSKNCPLEYVPFPANPIFNGYFQVIYSYGNLTNDLFTDAAPNYVCNDRRHCLHLSGKIIPMNGLDCRAFEEISNENNIMNLYDLHSALRSLADMCSSMGSINNYSSNSSLFYCRSSNRYISEHRVIDGIDDCYYKEDETYPDSCLFNDTQRFECQSKDKCLSPIGIGFAWPDCDNKEDTLVNIFRPLPFAHLCNRYPELERDESGETDESNCQGWPCHQPHTRCDGIFHCANGIDETNCSRFGCGINELTCKIHDSEEYRCIRQDLIYEKPINCTQQNEDDTICRRFFHSANFINDKNEYLSWKEKTCLRDNDICGEQSVINDNAVCQFVQIPQSYACERLVLDIDNNQPLCLLSSRRIHMPFSRFFSTFHLGYFPSKINGTRLTSQRQSTNMKRTKHISVNIVNSTALIEYCNRGILIYEGASYEKRCLCPPSYFGDRCQWQSQRVSLTLRIRLIGSVEKKNSIYHLFIYLLDNVSNIIHSYEEILFVPSVDCETKFNRYLLYSSQAKDINHTYSIHIDVYDKITLKYYASWLLSIPFPFLPVNRLATQIIIPSERSLPSTNCSSLECGTHGTCYNYINSPESFCQCTERYSGRSCQIKHHCSCSSDSICLNPSVCLCPLNRFGSQCYLQHRSCQPHTNSCPNNGQCIPTNDRISSKGFLCLSTEDCMGFNCEDNFTRIDIHLKVDIIPSIIFAHFITALQDKPHGRRIKFKKIPFDQDAVTLFTKQSFHILFIEFNANFYLAVVREEFIPSEHMSVDIQLDHMCRNITTLLNTSVLAYSYLRQMKFYPSICVNNPKLKCFYDDIYMCICDPNRYSNCFNFNRTMSYDCRGYNYCQNGGRCFEDNITCPTQSVCMCDKCYYGNKCQFNTKGFSLSLDAIFGYHIKPSISFVQQSKSVKITAAVTILIVVFGLISGSLSTLTFRRKSLIAVGCGIYLLTNSVISSLTMITLLIKYWQLVLFQMKLITNRSFLDFNCLLTDILLKVFLSSGDWFNACVAAERALTVIQGVRFNKARSRYTAQRVIPIIFILTIISYLHDPLYRQLFYDEDEQRTWCTVDYSSKLKIYDRFINIFHFLVPFIVNVLSALVIVIQMFRMRMKIKKNATPNSVLYVEIKRHRHILITPCILILLTLPRLIISFLSKCMESTRDPWLFLVGYYISFVPSLLMLIVFVLPSKIYRDEFLTLVRRKPPTSN